MKVSQYIHTSCGNNNNFAQRGYMTYGKSSDITDLEVDEIQKILNYKLRVPEYRHDADPETIDKTFPRKLAFFRLSTGKYCLAQSAYVGLDCEGTRYGNYFIHAFVFDKSVPVDPYKFANSNQFRRVLTKEEMMGPVPGTLPQLEINQENGTFAPLHIQGEEVFKRLMIFLRDRSFTEADKIFIRIDPQDIPSFLTMLSRHIIKGGEPIPFLTYMNAPKDYREKINLFFETAPVEDTANIIGNFHTYYFDLLENKTNVEVKVNSYDDMWLGLLLKNEEEALNFSNTIEEVKRKYNIESNLAAYAIKVVIEGSYERIGGIPKAVALFAKHLAAYRPSEVADNIYMAMNDSEQGDVNLVAPLYESFSERIKENVLVKYINKCLDMAESTKYTMDQLVNPPYGSSQDILDLIFRKGISNQIMNRGDQGRLLLFALSSKDRVQESTLIEYYSGLTSSRREGFEIYREYMKDKDYRSLAKVIFESLRNESLSYEDLSILYPLLPNDNQEEILKKYFDDVLARHLPLEEAVNALIERNPFTSIENAKRVLTGGSFFSHLLSMGDYEKLLALRLTSYTNYDEGAVLGIYQSINRKDKSMQSMILSIASELRRGGDQVAAKFVNENISSYNNEQEIESLLNDLREFPAHQSQLIPQLFETRRIGLEKAMDFAMRYTNARGNRIELLRDIASNRTNPERAKDICERNSEDLIAKTYMSTFFKEDLHNLVKNVKSPNSALDLLKKYDLTAEDTRLVISMITSPNLPDLNQLLTLETVELVKTKALAVGINPLPSKLCEVEVLKLIKSGSRGDFEPLKQRGFPNVKLYSGYRVESEFIKLAFDQIIQACLAYSDKSKAVNALLSPLAAVDNGLLRRLCEKDGTSTFVSLAYQYIKAYPNDAALDDIFEEAIKRYFKKIKPERRKAEAEGLGIASADIEKYAPEKSEGFFSKLFGFGKKD